MAQKPAFVRETVDGVDVGEMLRNTRPDITPKGTRVADVVKNVRYDGPAVLRMWAERENRDRVFAAWEKKWGPLDRNLYHEVRHVHLTAQVVTELLVYPEGV